MASSSRRSLIVFAGVAGGAAIAGVSIALLGKGGRKSKLVDAGAVRHPLLIFDVATVFPPGAYWAIRELGPRAVEKLGVRADRELLHRQLFAASRWDDATRRFRRKIRAQIAEDFAAGRVASLDGWVTAWSELRLYALLWLALGERGLLDTGRKGKGKAVASAKPARTPNPGAGAEIYKQFCVGCHQPDGGGLNGLTAADLRGPPAGKPAEELAEVVVDGAQSARGNMPGFGEDLSDEEIDDVVAYIKREFATLTKK